MIRRNFLKILGFSSLSSLFLRETPKLCKRRDPKIVPLPFSLMNEGLPNKLGMKPGLIYPLVTKSVLPNDVYNKYREFPLHYFVRSRYLSTCLIEAFARTIAIHASQYGSVAYLSSLNENYEFNHDLEEVGDLYLYSQKYERNEDLFKMICQEHDIIVVSRYDSNVQRLVELAVAHNCFVVEKTYYWWSNCHTFSKDRHLIESELSIFPSIGLDGPGGTDTYDATTTVVNHPWIDMCAPSSPPQYRPCAPLTWMRMEKNQTLSELHEASSYFKIRS